jgi:hypothetical protein
MADESEKSPSVELEGKVDATGAAGKVKLTAVDKLARVLRPGTYRQQEAFDIIATEIRRKQAAQESLSKLEAAVLVAELEPILERAINAKRIIGYALEDSPEIAQLVESRSPALLAARSGEPEASAEDDSSDPEDVYFFDRFWSDAEIVSVEHVQRLYGKILAGKMKHRSSFSLATLNVVRCLDQHSAKWFAWVLPFRIANNVLPGHNEEVYGGKPLDMILRLTDAGLLNASSLSLNTDKTWQIGDYLFKSAKPTAPQRPFAPLVMVLSLTRAGLELAATMTAPVTRAHVLAIAKFLGGQLELVWAKVGSDDFKPWTGSLDD